MKKTLFDRLTEKNKVILFKHENGITAEATRIMLSEEYHWMFLPYICILNLKDIFNINISDILEISDLFIPSEEI